MSSSSSTLPWQRACRCDPSLERIIASVSMRCTAACLGRLVSRYALRSTGFVWTWIWCTSSCRPFSAQKQVRNACFRRGTPKRWAAAARTRRRWLNLKPSVDAKVRNRQQRCLRVAVVQVTQSIDRLVSKSFRDQPRVLTCVALIKKGPDAIESPIDRPSQNS